MNKYTFQTVVLLSITFVMCNKFAKDLQEENVDRLPISTEYTPLEDTITTTDAFFKEIPGGYSNWRSAEPDDTTDLRKFLVKYDIRKIIRLNSENEPGSTLSILDELRLGVEVEYINLHEYAYVKGKGYVEALEKIHEELIEGKVLIHCLHGFDRAGSAVAFHLRQLGISKDEIIAHNGWENYLTTKGEDYLVYYEALYN